MLEKLVKDNPQRGISKIAEIAEEITRVICIEEKLEFALEMNQKERLELLNNEEVIEGEISIAFDVIRFVENASVKGLIDIGVEDAGKLYNALNTILPWCNKNYRVNIDLEIKKNEDAIKEELNKSYLLRELYKLRESSQEAVEGSTELSDFKKYLHVERSIQEELIEVLRNSGNEGELILLAGSVGDGKSHLLAYISNEYPELLEGYIIHNDATESFDPKKTSIETLGEVIEGFSDENIDRTKEKVVLAINLGILYNFLESKIGMEKYKKLKSFIYSTGLFDEGKVTENVINNKFKLVTFSDYRLFQVTESGVKSSYITTLLNRITEKNESNPFYKGYKMDLERGYWSPVIDNYRLLMSKDLQKQLVQLLIKVIIKEKKLISTRELLNFIYDIVVPDNIGSVNDREFTMKYCNMLLPNLVFGRKNKSKLLESITNYDPLDVRNNILDEVITMVNISQNLQRTIDKYLDTKYIDSFCGECIKLEKLEEAPVAIRNDIVKTIVRNTYFIGKETKEVFVSESYSDYIMYLYHYNTQNFIQYKRLFQEIREGIATWNGSPEKDYLYINNLLDTMKIAEKLSMKAALVKNKSKYVQSLERFKSSIYIAFKVGDQEKIVSIEVDYNLYRTIRNILKGYCPNRQDKEDAIVFTEFIDKLLRYGEKDKEVYIKDEEDNLSFKLEYDEDFEVFSFRRVQ